MKKKYCVRPGLVKSPNDGQTHYIVAMALIRLYGVDERECVIFEPAPWWPASYYEMCLREREGLIQLFPKSNGNYAL